jgi:hypothetical protein
VPGKKSLHTAHGRALAKPPSLPCANLAVGSLAGSTRCPLRIQPPWLSLPRLILQVPLEEAAYLAVVRFANPPWCPPNNQPTTWLSARMLIPPGAPLSLSARAVACSTYNTACAQGPPPHRSPLRVADLRSLLSQLLSHQRCRPPRLLLPSNAVAGYPRAAQADAQTTDKSPGVQPSAAVQSIPLPGMTRLAVSGCGCLLTMLLLSMPHGKPGCEICTGRGYSPTHRGSGPGGPIRFKIDPDRDFNGWAPARAGPCKETAAMGGRERTTATRYRRACNPR